MLKHSYKTALGLAVLVFASAANSQSSATPSSIENAPQNVLTGFAVRAATMQKLTVPQQSQEGFAVSVNLGGRDFILTLLAKDIRAKDYKLLISDANGLRPAPRSPNTTYRGTVDGFPDSLVAATLYQGQLTALIAFSADEPLWNVQPLTEVDKTADRSVHVMHNHGDSIEPEHQCGTNHNTVPTIHRRPTTAKSSASNTTQIAEIAIDADNPYYVKKGSNTTSTEAAVNTVLNGMGVIYKRDVDVDYQVTRMIVRTTRVYSNTDTCSILSEFRSRWSANHGGIRRDLAHLFTGVGSFSGVIGCAYLGVVCGSSAYGASKAYHSSTSTNVGLVAHECGHNWSSGHCSGGSCYIMCAGLGGCGRNLTKFGASSISTITGYRDSLRCLDKDPFLRVGGGISGVNGNPRYTGEGFINNTANPPKITLSNYRANTLGVFVVGLTPIKINYFGGLLVPAPDVVFGITGNGSPIVLDASALRTSSLSNLWTQAFYVDAAAQQGLSATSGYRIFIR
jgi:hypothetical protein